MPPTTQRPGSTGAPLFLPRRLYSCIKTTKVKYEFRDVKGLSCLVWTVRSSYFGSPTDHFTRRATF